MPATAIRHPRAFARFAAAALSLAAAGAACSNDQGPNQRPLPTSISIVGGNNQTGTVNGLLPLALVVHVEDPAGTGYPGLTIEWSVVSGGGALEGTTSTTDSVGDARMRYVLGPTAGTNKVRAAVQGSTLEAQFTAMAEPESSDNSPAEIFLISGNNQSATAGTPLADSLVVEVRNASGTPLGGVAITWTVTAGSGTLGAATRVTSPSGRAANAYSPDAGASTITAAVQVKPTLTVTFNATGN